MRKNSVANTISNGSWLRDSPDSLDSTSGFSGFSGFCLWILWILPPELVFTLQKYLCSLCHKYLCSLGRKYLCSLYQKYLYSLCQKYLCSLYQKYLCSLSGFCGFYFRILWILWILPLDSLDSVDSVAKSYWADIPVRCIHFDPCRVRDGHDRRCWGRQVGREAGVAFHKGCERAGTYKS